MKPLGMQKSMPRKYINTQKSSLEQNQTNIYLFEKIFISTSSKHINDQIIVKA